MGSDKNLTFHPPVTRAAQHAYGITVYTALFGPSANLCPPYYFTILYSSLFTWIYRVCILCLCTQPTEAETTSIYLSVTGTSIRQIEISDLSFASRTSLLVTASSKLCGIKQDSELRSNFEETPLFTQTHISEEGLHFKLW